MMASTAFLLDTNILLRLTQTEASGYATLRNAVDSLWAAGAELCYAQQNLIEFWNVCTRPSDRNGLGLTVSETDAKATLIEGRLKLLPESEAAYRTWRGVVVESGVSGVQVHDARLVATMLANQITHLLTLNGRDFRRYAGIIVLSPEDVLQDNR